MDVVINASPLIFLHKIDRLDVLNKMFDTVYIPKAVLKDIEGLINAGVYLSDKLIERVLNE